MAKYDVEYNKCESMTPNTIINTYELSINEIKAMRYLYNTQQPKKDIIENLYWSLNIKKKEVSYILGSLKRKGLIYSNISLPGWLGTDIKV
jgi:predicted DNA-binding transcriptional regulator